MSTEESSEVVQDAPDMEETPPKAEKEEESEITEEKEEKEEKKKSPFIKPKVEKEEQDMEEAATVYESYQNEEGQTVYKIEKDGSVLKTMIEEMPKDTPKTHILGRIWS